MKNFSKKLSLIIAFIFFSNFVFGQSNEIKIKFIGNAGLYMTDGSLNVYVDFPYKSGAHRYMEYDKSELDSIKDNSIFIFTHRHADHYSKKLLKKINGKIYGPWQRRKKENDVEIINDSINDFSVKAFKTSHKFTFKHNSYLITWHNKKIFISGDTGDLEAISKTDNIEWAFVPYWILLNAKEESVNIDAKKFGVYHLYPNQIINGEAPETIHLLKKQGEVLSISY